ncbi:polysaccharide deacetylase family protein [Spirochaeta africana]|uniref:Putative xylanase/chitin deacetylase n=1 Tax=Spirochaeta africana (strain ATCC 700263 / DSM 8902 / Z-7692) TaxID=889378 RepID=H9UMK1_SPIAZ|nr:polysaccharide deacetylase family protein [Spirochaeta africana]AFG38744.1 putative xylanase/chitin deacetylase [Spirochaeta africana DSM 8902]
MGIPNAVTRNRGSLRLSRHRLILQPWTLVTLWFAVMGAVVLPVSAETVFSSVRVSTGNELLFEAGLQAPGFGAYRTAFLADMEDRSLAQLTIFPERVSRIPGSQQLRVHNRFGLFHLDTDSGVVEPAAHYPAFTRGDAIRTGKLPPLSVSPDGQFLVFFRKSSPAYGDLVLYDVHSEQETVLAEYTPLRLDRVPVSWAPDGANLVYSAGGQLYYFSLQQHRRGRVSEAHMRQLGPGQIQSVQWGHSGSLYYIRGSLVYRIRPNELFARTLYQDIIRIGTMVGKLPFVFDGNFDRFTIAPDGSTMLFTKSERTVFLLYLQGDDYTSTGEVSSLPYLYLPRNARVADIAWSRDDLVTLITTSLRNGEPHHELFRLDLAGDTRSFQFERVPQEGVLGLALDSRHSRILLRTVDGIEIRRYRDWELLDAHAHPKVLHALWLDDTRIALAGPERYEVFDTAAGQARWAGFAAPRTIGFGATSGRPVVSAGGTVREWLTDEQRWIEPTSEELQPPQQVNQHFRVFLESQPEGTPYRNLVMLREDRGVATRRLFDLPPRRYEPFPEYDDEIDFRVFSHGSRIRRREVALVFNAADGVEGLATILQVLRDYGIRATFFVNGEFIERNPAAAREIAESGHEVGNMFHAHFDMTDTRFRMTPDFIQHGLARNEDDFFAASGRELSLIWHAPYYYVSSGILDAAEELGYAYIGRDVDALDWVPKRTQDGGSGLYRRSPELVERIIDQKQPGSIIAMQVGVPGEDQLDGGRDDYLFQYLDVLVNALIERGYSFVPVSTLRDRVQ